MRKFWILFFFAPLASAKDFSGDLCELALIPNVYQMHIVENLEPQRVRHQQPLTSPAIQDLWLKLGRRTAAFDDFKFISDLQRLQMPEIERQQIIAKAKEIRKAVFQRSGDSSLAQKFYVRWVINHLYRFDGELRPLNHEMVKPKIKVEDPRYQKAVEHIEGMWQHLTMQSREFSHGSLIPSPFPVVVAGGRFRESYYWDSYFGALGLMTTGRTDLVAAQLENFLHMIQVYGKVPNGFRDYYLTRSQPPVISLMTMQVYKARPDKKWLTQRAFPLLQHDYHNFWMKQRFDPGTGLNFYSDDLDQPRPERHSKDDESKLGKSYRCVRGQAESGLDFTDAMMGDCVLSVSLNALLYRYELDLAEMAEIAGQTQAAADYRAAADRRKFAIGKYLWRGNSFRNFSLSGNRYSEIDHADQFAMLFTGAASLGQAHALRTEVLPRLERRGGLAASTSNSGKQWDGDHGWAPLQMMAIQGLANYGYNVEARRLANKWVDALNRVFAGTGAFYEKIDVGTGRLPHEDGSKYPNQTGFLWTNASFLWALNFLGVEMKPL